MSHGTGGTVTPMSAWKNSGTVVSIHATPASGYSFTTWSGSGAGIGRGRGAGVCLGVGVTVGVTVGVGVAVGVTLGIHGALSSFSSV